LLNQFLREKRREKIYQNFKSAQQEEQNNNLQFSADIDELKQMLEE
jgi:hypothetical protein